MITGAWMAAMQDRIRLRKMKGYGSSGRKNRVAEFIPIQHSRNTPNQIRNVQLPPKAAMRSANRSPNDHFCSNSDSTSVESNSCSRRLRNTSCSSVDNSPFSDSSRACT